MKIEKNVKKSLKIALTFLAIGLLLGTIIVFAATPSSTIYISPGIYPGAPSYTVWKEGSNYFAKDSNGQLEFSGTNASQIIQNAIDNGYYIFIKKGNYILTHILSVAYPRRISGELTQWVGNEANPNPPEVGTNLYFAGDAPNANFGVLNITCLNQVIIEYLSIEGKTQTRPYLTMCGIQLSGPSGIHRAIIRRVDITYFNVGIGGIGGAQGTVDSKYVDVGIQNCSVGLQVVSTGNSFENIFFWQNDYCVEFIGTVHGHHGTSFTNCFFNDPVYYSLWFYSAGNETEMSFTDCWFENSDHGLITITPAALTVKNLIFSRCHFHTFNTTATYYADFSKITEGLVQILSCTFDGSGGTITATNPSSHIVIEKCWLKTAGGLEPYKGTVNSGSATIATGATVAHGLIKTPTCVLVTATITGLTDIYVSDIGTTTFKINFAGGGSNVFYWYAEYKP